MMGFALCFLRKTLGVLELENSTATADKVPYFVYY
jgi:hypothetical protein